MALIVTSAFFKNDINLPNTADPKVLEKINSFIQRYEPECLLKILGYPLYKKFGTESSLRMTELLSGAEYTDENGDLRKWNGIKHQDEDFSLIAFYVYWYYIKNTYIQTTGTGTKVAKQEGGKEVPPVQKMVDAWNVFSSECKQMCSFLWNKKDDEGVRIYTEFSSYQLCQTLSSTRKISEFNF